MKLMKRQVSLAIVSIAALALAASAFAAPSKLEAKPSVSSAPTISGTTQEGSTLTVSNGNWNGSTPITYQYQWRRCGPFGGSCADIGGQTASTYVVKTVDVGNTLRARVIASNADGSTSATSSPTAKVSAAASTPATGCPAAASGATVSASDVTSPARLQISQFVPTPAFLQGTMTSFTLRVVVTDTCGQNVQGALVYATAVPFRQVTIPAEAPTGSDGSVTLSFSRLAGFPATAHQSLMVLFIRARKTGDNVLAGITTSRLISIPVRLHG